MMKLFFLAYCLSYSGLVLSQQVDSTFVLCHEERTMPYYYPDLTYEGGFWVIKEHFLSEYPTEKFKRLKNNSGIITVQFKVNCKGETGNFIVKQCDLDYQPTELDKDISEHFLDATRMLDNWIPAKDEDGNTVNSHKFFSFKIKSGDLLEILPK